MRSLEAKVLRKMAIKSDPLFLSILNDIKTNALTRKSSLTYDYPSGMLFWKKEGNPKKADMAWESRDVLREMGYMVHMEPRFYDPDSCGDTDGITISWAD